MFTHSIYENIRVRVIIVQDGKVLLHAPCRDQTRRADDYRVLPGGGLEPDETLYEAGEREVHEETGLRVRVTSVAFLREWVVPKMVPAEEMKLQADAWGFEYEEADFPDHGYGVEVYLWAEIPEGEPTEPSTGGHLTDEVPEWVPLEQVPKEPLFPTELKALARDLAEARKPVGVPTFASTPADPWDDVEGSRVHP
jgi:ADP-ribose pyrophosphatase YjhB (NUDIX family)